MPDDRVIFVSQGALQLLDGERPRGDLLIENDFFGEESVVHDKVRAPVLSALPSTSPYPLAPRPHHS